MKELLIAPAVVIIILGLAIELESLATSSSEKALSLANDMNNAMDCATSGIPIRICSPDLFTKDFGQEINKTIEIAEEMRQLINATEL